MRWLEVTGPPAVGKSTVCDKLWHPTAIDWKNAPPPPKDWEPFLECTDMMLALVRHHPTYEACARMTNRTLKKMSAVYADPRNALYVQTGLVQRGLGFGWRLGNPEDVAEYFQMMPVSEGVVFLDADPGIVIARNHRRLRENRAFMVMPMQRPIAIAKDVLKRRGVPVLELSTEQSIEQTRLALALFASEQITEPASA